MICNNTKLWEKLDGSCLKQDKISSSPKGVINLDIAYKTNFWSYDLNSNFILWNALFEIVKWTQNRETDNFIILDMALDLIHVHLFHCPNVVDSVRGVGKSSSARADNRKKDILNLIKTQQMD